MEQEALTTRVLIATAGFGEGHNSAASGLKQALGPDEVAQIVDPCEIAAPYINNRVKKAYRRLTTHTPYIWKGIYNACDRRDFSKERVPLMRKIRATLGSLIEEKEAEALLSTYFLYPYFLERHVKRKGRRVPVFTVVTDSIEINAAWFKAPCDDWFVTDRFTRQKLVDFGLSPSVVHEFGFPIQPRFKHLTPLPHEGSISPFKVLFFPTANRPRFKSSLRTMLEADPSVEATVVMGKNVKALYRSTLEIKAEFSERVTFLGWTQLVPELLSSHHVIVGKAGGATVHEAIAANCPMLVHHIVPGQEEGNLALLESSGCGSYVDSSSELKDAVQKLVNNDGALWREQKENMKKIAKPDAAETIAQFVLDKIG